MAVREAEVTPQYFIPCFVCFYTAVWALPSRLAAAARYWEARTPNSGALGPVGTSTRHHRRRPLVAVPPSCWAPPPPHTSCTALPATRENEESSACFNDERALPQCAPPAAAVAAAAQGGRRPARKAAHIHRVPTPPALSPVPPPATGPPSRLCWPAAHPTGGGNQNPNLWRVSRPVATTLRQPGYPSSLPHPPSEKEHTRKSQHDPHPPPAGAPPPTSGTDSKNRASPLARRPGGGHSSTTRCRRTRREQQNGRYRDRRSRSRGVSRR